MDPRPIKRSENIMKLSREHHFSLLFCWKIREGIKKKVAPWRIVQYVRYFWDANLQPHFKEEEQILFAPLPDDAMVARAVEEHAAIQQGVEVLYTSPEAELWEELVKFADLLDKHVRYEERQLFPHLESVLTGPQLDAVGRQLNTAHASPLKDDYDDEFWKEKNASL